MKRRDPEQLNIPAASDEPEYDLEDILREFGTASETEKTPSMTKDTVAFRPVRTAPPKPQTDAPMKVAGPAGTPPVLYKEDPPQTVDPPVQAEKAAETQRKPEKGAAETQPPSIQEEKPPKKAKKRTHAEKAAEKQAKPPKKRAPAIAAAPPPPDPVEECRRLRETLSSTRLRLWLAAAVSVLNTFLLVYENFGWSFLPLQPTALPIISVILLVLTVIVCFEVAVLGTAALIRLRPTPNTLGLLAAAFAVADAIIQKEAGYCGIAACLIFCLFRGSYARRSGRLHTLRTLCAFEQPVGIFTVPKLVKEADSLRRDAASAEDFMLRLDTADLPERVLRIYSTVVLFAAPAAAYLLAGYSQITFIRCWMLLLLGAVPLSSGLCFARPFAILARRLRRIGGALCGWHSAKVFRGQHTLVLRDADLFPHVVSSGMKLYGAHNHAMVIAYALAALQTVEHPLCDQFEALLKAQYGRRYTADHHRRYDVGGVGAEVNGDVVLAGSLSFMRAMGVHMPEGTRVRQAVYVSVNGELAGVFAFKYKPSASTRAGLAQVLEKPRIRVVLATRDFLITPELIAAKYELPTQTLVFPSYGERLRLSASDHGQPTEQGAIIAGDGFGAFASTVASGRLLHSASLLSLWLCLLAGAFGFLLCGLLIFWGSASAASALHLGIFHLLWNVLTSFVTFIALRP